MIRGRDAGRSAVVVAVFRRKIYVWCGFFLTVSTPPAPLHGRFLCDGHTTRVVSSSPARTLPPCLPPLVITGQAGYVITPEIGFPTRNIFFHYIYSLYYHPRPPQFGAHLLASTSARATRRVPVPHLLRRTRRQVMKDVHKLCVRRNFVFSKRNNLLNNYYKKIPAPLSLLRGHRTF